MNIILTRWRRRETNKTFFILKLQEKRLKGQKRLKLQERKVKGREKRLNTPMQQKSRDFERKKISAKVCLSKNGKNGEFFIFVLFLK